MHKKARPRFLAPVNGKPASEHAFRWSCQLARHAGAELYAIHVFEVPLELPLDTTAMLRDHQDFESILTRVEEIASSEKYRVNASLLEARNAGPAIVLEAAERGMDLVVIGLPFDGRIDSHSVGATSAYVLKNAPCQVILSREPALDLPAYRE